MRRQSERSVRALTTGLRKYDLTKAEKLQMVNLAPTEPVELYVVSHRFILSIIGTGLLISLKVVEELEDRFDSMDEILELVKSTLSDSPNDLGQFFIPPLFTTRRMLILSPPSFARITN